MKNIIKTLMIFILFNFDFLNSMTREGAFDACETDNVDIFEKYLDSNPEDINFVLFGRNEEQSDLLLYAIMQGAEKIGSLLIRRGITLKYVNQFGGTFIRCSRSRNLLYHAFINDKLTVDFVRLLSENGFPLLRGIEDIYETSDDGQPYYAERVLLIFAAGFPGHKNNKNQADKRKFILNHIQQLCGNNLLNVVQALIRQGYSELDFEEFLAIKEEENIKIKNNESIEEKESAERKFCILQ